MQQPYAEQIDDLVQGFVQVWIKFEAMLPAEMARVPGLFDGMKTQGEPHPSRNYELFFRVSSVLSPVGSLTMSEFSSAMSVPLSTATRMADWLVGRGYIERLPDAGDRRIVRIALTDMGKGLHKIIESYIRGRVEQILSCLTAEERVALFRLIGKVASSVRDMSQ